MSSLPPFFPSDICRTKHPGIQGYFKYPMTEVALSRQRLQSSAPIILKMRCGRSSTFPISFPFFTQAHLLEIVHIRANVHNHTKM